MPLIPLQPAEAPQPGQVFLVTRWCAPAPILRRSPSPSIPPSCSHQDSLAITLPPTPAPSSSTFSSQASSYSFPPHGQQESPSPSPSPSHPDPRPWIAVICSKDMAPPELLRTHQPPPGDFLDLRDTSILNHQPCRSIPHERRRWIVYLYGKGIFRIVRKDQLFCFKFYDPWEFVGVKGGTEEKGRFHEFYNFVKHMMDGFGANRDRRLEFWRGRIKNENANDELKLVEAELRISGGRREQGGRGGPWKRKLNPLIDEEEVEREEMMESMRNKKDRTGKRLGRTNAAVSKPDSQSTNRVLIPFETDDDETEDEVEDEDDEEERGRLELELEKIEIGLKRRELERADRTNEEKGQLEFEVMEREIGVKRRELELLDISLEHRRTCFEAQQYQRRCASRHKNQNNTDDGVEPQQHPQWHPRSRQVTSSSDSQDRTSSSLVLRAPPTHFPSPGPNLDVLSQHIVYEDQTQICLDDDSIILKPEYWMEEHRSTDQSPSDPQSHEIWPSTLVKAYIGPANTVFYLNTYDVLEKAPRIQEFVRNDGRTGSGFIMDPFFMNIDPNLFTSVAEFLCTGEYEPRLLLVHDTQIPEKDEQTYHEPAEDQRFVPTKNDADYDAKTPSNDNKQPSPRSYKLDLPLSNPSSTTELTRSAHLYRLASLLHLPNLQSLILNKLIHGYAAYPATAVLEMVETIFGRAPPPKSPEGDANMPHEHDDELEKWLMAILAHNLESLFTDPELGVRIGELLKRYVRLRKGVYAVKARGE